MTEEGRQHIPHVFQTSANLFGICAMLITGLHFGTFYLNTIIDEVLSVTALCYFISCVLSYLSMRTLAEHSAMKLERAADYIFLTSMFAMAMSLILLVLQYL